MPPPLLRFSSSFQLALVPPTNQIPMRSSTQTHRRALFSALFLVAASAGFVACGEDDPAPVPPSNTAGTGGSGGSGGADAGTGGSAGTGAGGSAAGTDAGGSAGAEAAGAGGAAGAGDAGQGGSAGAPAATQPWRDLVFSGTGFSVHKGSQFVVAISLADSGKVVAGKKIAAVADDTFIYTWPGLLAPGVAYNVDYYADLNNNKACDAPANDHVWRRSIGATDPGTLTVTHDTAWTDQCPSFTTLDSRKSLSFSATGFSIHDGAKIEIVVTRSSDGAAVAHGGYDKFEGDTLAFSWDGLLEVGQAYTVDYYVDVNGDGHCNPPADDHVWRRDIPAVTNDVAVTTAHDSIWVDVCASFSKLAAGDRDRDRDRSRNASRARPRASIGSFCAHRCPGQKLATIRIRITASRRAGPRRGARGRPRRGRAACRCRGSAPAAGSDRPPR
jgi:hypothetical protein